MTLNYNLYNALSLMLLPHAVADQLTHEDSQDLMWGSP